MSLSGINIGIGVCGSFCTLKSVIEEMKILKEMGVNLYPVLSENVQNTDTRFGQACVIKKEITEIAQKEPIISIKDAEPLGPQNFLDAFIVAPCTGNTLAKLNCGITDTYVFISC